MTSYKSRCIRQWADEFCQTGELSSYRQGRHFKCKSVITDENFAWQCTQHLRTMKDEFRTPLNFMTYVNDELLPHTNNAPMSISLKTAIRWMRFIGFNLVHASKGWFTDGH